jgi:hypothetical protein
MIAVGKQQHDRASSSSHNCCLFDDMLRPSSLLDHLHEASLTSGRADLAGPAPRDYRQFKSANLHSHL